MADSREEDTEAGSREVSMEAIAEAMASTAMGVVPEVQVEAEATMAVEEAEVARVAVEDTHSH